MCLCVDSRAYAALLVLWREKQTTVMSKSIYILLCSLAPDASEHTLKPLKTFVYQSRSAAREYLMDLFTEALSECNFSFLFVLHFL